MCISCVKFSDMSSCSVALDVRCTLGESPVWHASDGVLYFIDIKQGLVHAFTPSTGAHRVIENPGGGEIGALCPIGSTTELLICRTEDVVKLDTAHGTVSTVATVPPAHRNPAMRFNDGKASPQGVLITGYMHADWRNGHAGRLYALQDGQLTDVLDNVGLPNGMAWHGTSAMYFVDSAAGTITEYQCDTLGVPIRDQVGMMRVTYVHSSSALWQLPCYCMHCLQWSHTESHARQNQAQQVVCIPKEEGVPDGMTVDDQGRLWVALGEAGAVACYEPTTGAQVGVHAVAHVDEQVHNKPFVAQVAKVPLLCKRPTACTFGGDDLGILYVTTREETGADASPHHGALLAVQMAGVRGAAAAAVVQQGMLARGA